MEKSKVFKIFIGAVFALCIFVLVLFFSPLIKDFFLAAVLNSNVISNVTVKEFTCSVDSDCESGKTCSEGDCIVAQQNQNTGGGGGGYYPTVLAPTVPPEQKPTIPTVQQPEQPIIAENPTRPVESPVAISENTQQPPTITSLLPLAVADLSAKIPEFASILSNLNVKTAQDVAGLQNYNIFLPPVNPAEMPTDMVITVLGKGNINALTKLDFSADAPSLEQINVLVGKPMHLVVKPSSPASSVAGYILFDNFSVLKFTYNDNDNDGIYVADINSPSVEGQYQIISSISYESGKTKDVKITTLVDPDGYIYEKIGDKELRVNNATVSLYKLNNKNQYELWNANDYGQENPQTTDTTGNYSFLVPVGTYYLTVNAPGYYPYKSDAVSVMEGKEIHSNIALKKEFDLSSFLNWNTILIFILFCMVIYNFYMDARRRKR